MSADKCPQFSACQSRFCDLTQPTLSNFISCCFFPHTLQCGQIEKLTPYIYQLSLAHAASFYLKCPSFGKRYLKSFHPSYFGANVTSSMKPSQYLSFLHCHLLLNCRSSETISPFSKLQKHLLFSGTCHF